MEGLTKCQMAIEAALRGGKSLTMMDLFRRTGFSTPAIGKALKHPMFQRDGQRERGVFGGMGPCPATYKLAPRQRVATQLVSEPLNPIVESLALNQLDIGRMIRRLATQGDSEAAMVLVKVWLNDDRELKRICERMES